MMGWYFTVSYCLVIFILCRYWNIKIISYKKLYWQTDILSWIIQKAIFIAEQFLCTFFSNQFSTTMYLVRSNGISKLNNPKYRCWHAMINCNPQMNSLCRAGSLLICYLKYDTVGLSGVIKGCGHELLSNRATNQLQTEPSYVQT